MPFWVRVLCTVYAYLAVQCVWNIIVPIYNFEQRYAPEFGAKCGFAFHRCTGTALEFIRYNQNIAVQDFLWSVGVVIAIVYWWTWHYEQKIKQLVHQQLPTHQLEYMRKKV